jgi:DDE superfamily endonuclease
VYQAAPTAAKQGVRTVSIDEMTGIQALERANPSLPVKPGHVERREFEYTRHGTKALIAAFDFASGKVRGTVSNTRTEADFVSFLDNLFASVPPRSGSRSWSASFSAATTSSPRTICGRGLSVSSPISMLRWREPFRWTMKGRPLAT